jgi:poly-gamma-glutamate capsule biosynthesis protein CapA/YwtB (metallophosphatase superfamily)
MSPRTCRRLVAAFASAAVLASCTSTSQQPRPNAQGRPSTSAPSSPQPATGSPAESPAATATTNDPPRTVTMVMSGDVLLHEGLWYTAQADAARTGRGRMDFRPLLAPMRPVIRGADLAICHLETPLAPKGGPYSGYPVFSVPPQIVPALKWEGYDACTTASNHSLDGGYEGLRRTLHTLDAGGIAHAGTATSRRDQRRPLLLEADGVRVALISATYGTNGIPVPAAQPWSVPIIDVPDLLREAKLARRLGAQIVVVALHWGVEYQNQPSADQVRIANRLLASPAVDLVYGHHVHVVQPFDKIHGKWVDYGLGNAVAQQETTIPGLYDGVTARFTFTERQGGRFRVTKAEYIPTYVTHYVDANPNMRWLDVPVALHRPNTSPALKAELRAALARITANVDLRHARAAGLTRGR